MSEIPANNPNRSSWVAVPEGSDFPIQNLPFGVFSTAEDPTKRVGVALGDSVIDLHVLFKTGLLNDLGITEEMTQASYLNPLMRLGKVGVRTLRNRIADLFDQNNRELQDQTEIHTTLLIPQPEATLHLPVQIGDYTDFYSSREHATNVGTMFRDPNNALLPNWLHIPVGYHGRASSIIPSGTPIHRPKGQQKPDNVDNPIFGPSKLLDFELEMGFITFEGNALGDSIPVEESEDYIFGMCLFNDWSARDIQKWEYVPLGPFLAKNFASSMSPWIVTLDALEPYRCAGPEQSPEPLPYLQSQQEHSFDIALEALIQPNQAEETTVSQTNFKYMYWSMAQQLAHHTVNGCDIRSGDLLASGTISGSTPDSYGSMLEITWRGTKPVKMSDGTERKFIQDGDTVIMRGHCNNGQTRIGFGEVRSKVLPTR